MVYKKIPKAHSSVLQRWVGWVVLRFVIVVTLSLTDDRWVKFFISVTTNLFVFKNNSTSTSNLPSFSLEDSRISRRTKRIAAIIKVTKITVVRLFIERQHPFLLDSLNEIMKKNYTVTIVLMYIIYITIILIIELTLITRTCY